MDSAWRSSVRSCVGLRWLGAASELLVVKVVVVHIHMAKKHKIKYIFRPFKIHKKKKIQCSSKTLTKKHDKPTREGTLVQLSN